MRSETIDSLSDLRLDPYRDLKSSSTGPESGRFVVEGQWLTERLLESECITESILTNPNRLDGLRELVAEDMVIYVASNEMIRDLVGYYFHRGVLAVGIRPEPFQLAEVLAKPNPPRLVAVCSDMLDPYNIGGVIRSAAAMGVGAILLSSRCPDPYSRRVLRVSMGGTFRVPTITGVDIVDTLRTLGDEFGYRRLAAVADSNACPLARVTISEKVALVFGSEADGLTNEQIQLCDERLTIPMQGDWDSLNVATAASICFYHFRAGR